MATRAENKLIRDAILAINARYGAAYKKLIADIPSLLEENYNNSAGWKDVQSHINETLKQINEFAILQDYDKFFFSAYNSQIRQAKLAYKLNYNFSQIDQRAIDQLRSQNNWFVSKYQTLTDQKATLDKMQELWESGESIETATTALKEIFQSSQARISAYTQTTIITNNTRIRSAADLNNFDQNGIEKYIYRAVLDNVTTDLCESLNGQEYSIRKALDFQNKIDNDVNKIINDGQAANLPDWKIYNKTVEYLQKNDALAAKSGTAERPWQSTTILRTANPQKQGKVTVKSYKNLESVPGNKIPRPPLHYNCRSRIQPIL